MLENAEDVCLAPHRHCHRYIPCLLMLRIGLARLIIGTISGTTKIRPHVGVFCKGCSAVVYLHCLANLLLRESQPMQTEIHDADNAAHLLAQFNYFHDAVLVELRVVTTCSTDAFHVETLSSAMSIVVRLSHYNFKLSGEKVADITLQFKEAVQLQVDWRLFNDCDWGITRVCIVECDNAQFPCARFRAAIEWSVLRDGTWQTSEAVSFHFATMVVASTEP